MLILVIIITIIIVLILYNSNNECISCKKKIVIHKPENNFELMLTNDLYIYNTISIDNNNNYNVYNRDGLVKSGTLDETEIKYLLYLKNVLPKLNINYAKYNGNEYNTKISWLNKEYNIGFFDYTKSLLNEELRDAISSIKKLLNEKKIPDSVKL